MFFTLFVKHLPAFSLDKSPIGGTITPVDAIISGGAYVRKEKNDLIHDSPAAAGL